MDAVLSPWFVVVCRAEVEHYHTGEDASLKLHTVFVCGGGQGGNV